MTHSSPQVSDAAQSMASALQQILADLPFNAHFSDEEIEAVYARGYLDAQAGDTDSAFESFRIACLARPGSHKYLHAMAVMHKLNGNWEQALEMLRCIKTLHPGNLRADLEIAEALLALNQIDAAITQLDELLGKDAIVHGDEAYVLERAAAIRELLATRKVAHGA